jgi:uncharacterized protein YbaR (Trm112 family)
MLDARLLAILACPVCKTAVVEEGERLICARCHRRYPIRDGIPVMLIEEAELPAEQCQTLFEAGNVSDTSASER